MPHLTLEYSGNIKEQIDASDLFLPLHQVLVEAASIAIEKCKSRTVRLDEYTIGAGGAQKAFVHLSIRFLEGRPLQLKQDIGHRCLAILQKYFARSFAEQDLQISIEIQDIERDTYFKLPEGTL
jgi:5-carboxymethyl-2-hydroxymuconate isomerase